jgi:hypothetical protein
MNGYTQEQGVSGGGDRFRTHYDTEDEPEDEFESGTQGEEPWDEDAMDADTEDFNDLETEDFNDYDTDSDDVADLPDDMDVEV